MTWNAFRLYEERGDWQVLFLDKTALFW